MPPAPRKKSDPRTRWLLPVVLAVSAVLSFWKLGDGALRDWDESIYARMSVEMEQRGDRWSPYHNGEYFPTKPAGLYWLMMASRRVFGEGEFAFRFPAAASAVLAVGVTMRLALAAGGPVAAAVAGLLVATHRQWLEYARMAQTDAPLAAALAVAMLGLAEGNSWLFGLAQGCAFLIKGPAALTGVAVALAYRFLLPRPQRRRIDLGLLVAAAVAAPWHVQQIVSHGWWFINHYVGVELLQRSAKVLDGHRERWYFYAIVLFRSTPFNPLAALAAGALGWGVVTALRRRPAPRDALLILWAVIPLLMLTVAKTKCRWYIVQCLPPLGILAGLFTVSLIRRWKSFRWADLVLIALPIWNAGDTIFSEYLRDPNADDTRAVLAALPPRDQVPVLYEVWTPFMATGPVIFYADRQVKWLSSEADAQDHWLLAPDEVVDKYRHTHRIAATHGHRVLLSPLAPP